MDVLVVCCLARSRAGAGSLALNVPLCKRFLLNLRANPKKVPGIRKMELTNRLFEGRVAAPNLVVRQA